MYDIRNVQQRGRHMDISLAREYPSYKVQHGKCDPDLGLGTRSNAGECHKYKNENWVCFGNCDKRKSGYSSSDRFLTLFMNP